MLYVKSKRVSVALNLHPCPRSPASRILSATAIKSPVANSAVKGDPPQAASVWSFCSLMSYPSFVSLASPQLSVGHRESRPVRTRFWLPSERKPNNGAFRFCHWHIPATVSVPHPGNTHAPVVHRRKHPPQRLNCLSAHQFLPRKTCAARAASRPPPADRWRVQSPQVQRHACRRHS